MLYLFLQVLFASTFTLIIKWVQIRGRDDVLTIGAINYIVAAISIVPMFLLNDLAHVNTAAMLTGGSMGAVYFVAFFFAIYCIKMIGASSTTAVSVLSILFPITIAAMIWDEVPSSTQVVGIGLALLALTMIGNRKGNDSDTIRPWVTPVMMLVFFLLCGCSRLAQETFKHTSVPEQRPTFVLTAFTIAALPSLILLVGRRRPIRLKELLLGSLLGIANMLQTHLILNCLEYYPGFIVFPVVSAGAIVLTTLVATGVLRERLSAGTCVGIGLAVVALFMLH